MAKPKKSANINIRIDEALKNDVEEILDDLGLSITTAFTILAKQIVREKRIPFEITANVDPFFSDENMKALQESIQQYNEGKFVSKPLEDLKEYEK